MKTIRCAWNGITPVILHNPRLVNPLDPIAIAIKTLTSKKNKTEEDLRAISDLEWEGGMYWDDEVGVYVPADNIEACVREGAKARKKGKDITKAFSVMSLIVPLDTGRRHTLDELRGDYEFRDVRPMVVSRARVIRTRPRFNHWALQFDATFDENIIDLQTVVEAMQYAGRYVGLCDSRPKYGKFEVAVTALD